MERKCYEETCKAGLSHVERWRKGKREGEECPDVQNAGSEYLRERNSRPSLEDIEKYPTISELSAALGKEPRQAEALAHVALRQVSACVQICQKHLNDHPVVSAVSSQLHTLQNVMDRAEEARSHLVQVALTIMEQPFSRQEKGNAAIEGLEGEEDAQGIDVRDDSHWKKKAEELSVIVEELQRELKVTTEENRALRCGNVGSPTLCNRGPIEQDYRSLMPQPHGEQQSETGLALDRETKNGPSVFSALAELIATQAELQNLDEYCTEPPKQHSTLTPSVAQEEEGLPRSLLPPLTVETKVHESAPEASLERPHAEPQGSSTGEATNETKPLKGLLYSFGRWMVGSDEPGDQGDSGSSPIVV